MSLYRTLIRYGVAQQWIRKLNEIEVISLSVECQEEGLDSYCEIENRVQEFLSSRRLPSRGRLKTAIAHWIDSELGILDK